MMIGSEDEEDGGEWIVGCGRDQYFCTDCPLLIIEKRVRSKEIGPWGIWSERDAKGKRESERKREWMWDKEREGECVIWNSFLVYFLCISLYFI